MIISLIVLLNKKLQVFKENENKKEIVKSKYIHIIHKYRLIFYKYLNSIIQIVVDYKGKSSVGPSNRIKWTITACQSWN